MTKNRSRQTGVAGIILIGGLGHYRQRHVFRGLFEKYNVRQIGFVPKV